MDLANHLVYNGKLQCGTEAVAKGQLNLTSIFPKACDEAWLQHALDPARPVLFLDTDKCRDAREELSRDQISNPHEARLVAQLVRKFVQVSACCTVLWCLYRGDLNIRVVKQYNHFSN